jgi:hypothetical protein
LGGAVLPIGLRRRRRHGVGSFGDMRGSLGGPARTAHARSEGRSRAPAHHRPQRSALRRCAVRRRHVADPPTGTLGRRGRRIVRRDLRSPLQTRGARGLDHRRAPRARRAQGSRPPRRRGRPPITEPGARRNRLAGLHAHRETRRGRPPVRRFSRAAPAGLRGGPVTGHDRRSVDRVAWPRVARRHPTADPRTAAGQAVLA